MDNVKVDHLKKTYKDFVLNDITFYVPQGTVVGVIGENGAGKSTTLNCILDTVKPDSGEIYIFGKNIVNLDVETRNRIGAVIGEDGLPSNLTARQAEKVLRGVLLRWSAEKFNNYLKKFELPTDKQISAFSRGMKQKLMIAVALSHETSLLVLDEPTSGLDPIARDEIIDVFYDYIQDEKHSIIFSSHILSDLEKICDYILFIHKGKQIIFEEKNVLYEKYGILNCGVKEFEQVPPEAVIGFNKTVYGVNALVKRNLIGQKYKLEQAKIDDIMLYFIRGERK